MSPFDYVKQIMQGKKQLIVDEITEKTYSPFLTNRSLSYHQDTILYGNEMNKRHHLDKKLQNDFLLNSVRSMKRPFAKWAKAEKSENLECIKKVFNFSESKAREASHLLSKDQITELKEKIDLGGVNGRFK